MNAKEKALTVLFRLEKAYGAKKTFLSYQNPFQLLAATILSAQCTDKRVNIVTKILFKKYKTAKDFAFMPAKVLEKEIFSCGFYKNKAKNIIECAKIILEKHRGTVPNSMEELVQLPGVARKTANIVLSNAFGINAGIAVDTHVKRLSYRIGLSRQKDPQKIEKDLMEIVPQKKWDAFSLNLIEHGRAVCTARKPNCSGCILNGFCDSAFKA